MTELKESTNFKPRNLVGYLWLAFATFALILSLILAISSVVMEPVKLGLFFYSLTYVLFSVLLFVFYKIIHLKQESLAVYSLSLVIAILMLVCMFITNNI
jgi:hypothetical protein